MTRMRAGFGLAKRLFASLCLLSAIATPGLAQDEGEKEIERYRAMINDPMANPGYLNVDRGEQLWSQARGAKPSL